MVDIKNFIGNISVEKSGVADNLTIVLYCYFQDHMDHPRIKTLDDDGHDVWARIKTGEALKLISDEINNRYELTKK